MKTDTDDHLRENPKELEAEIRFFESLRHQGPANQAALEERIEELKAIQKEALLLSLILNKEP